MTMVLDTGAFVAVERNDRDLIALIKAERLAGRAPLTHGGVVGQVWRGGRARQASIVRLLPGVEIRSLDESFGKRVGVLLGVAKATDVVDAGVVLLADDGDEIFTSDPGDLRALARASGRHVELVRV
jgi:hypothetical protein